MVSFPASPSFDPPSAPSSCFSRPCRRRNSSEPPPSTTLSPPLPCVCLRRNTPGRSRQLDQIGTAQICPCLISLSSATQAPCQLPCVCHLRATSAPSVQS